MNRTAERIAAELGAGRSEHRFDSLGLARVGEGQILIRARSERRVVEPDTIYEVEHVIPGQAAHERRDLPVGALLDHHADAAVQRVANRHDRPPAPIVRVLNRDQRRCAFDVRDHARLGRDGDIREKRRKAHHDPQRRRVGVDDLHGHPVRFEVVAGCFQPIGSGRQSTYRERSLCVRHGLLKDGSQRTAQHHANPGECASGFVDDNAPPVRCCRSLCAGGLEVAYETRQTAADNPRAHGEGTYRRHVTDCRHRRHARVNSRRHCKAFGEVTSRSLVGGRSTLEVSPRVPRRAADFLVAKPAHAARNASSPTSANNALVLARDARQRDCWRANTRHLAVIRDI